MNLTEQLRKEFLDKGAGFEDIVGQESVKQQVKSALIAGRHLLIFGPPGIGKTTLGKNIAKILPEIELNDCAYHCSPGKPVCPECKSKKIRKTKKVSAMERFVRVQGSPDLSAEDLIGDIDPAKAIKYGPLSIEAFTPGKIFKANNGVLFFDELNRAPEKLQNSLLQALQEGTVTIGSYDLDLESNFIFIATMNPDDISTEPLSDVLMDRFDVVYMSYPETAEEEEEIVCNKSRNFIDFPEDVLRLAILFVRTLRQSQKLEKLPSVRASIGLYERAQTNALLNRRKSVEWRDVEDVLVSVLSHRIRLKPSAQYLQTPQEMIKEMLRDFQEQNGIEKEAKEGDVP